MFAVHIILLVLCLSACAFISYMLILGIVSHFSSNKYYCFKWGWHKQPNTQGFDGASCTGICPRCGKHVLLDSQGNWF